MFYYIHHSPFSLIFLSTSNRWVVPEFLISTSVFSLMKVYTAFTSSYF